MASSEKVLRAFPRSAATAVTSPVLALPGGDHGLDTDGGRQDEAVVVVGVVAHQVDPPRCAGDEVRGAAERLAEHGSDAGQEVAHRPVRKWISLTARSRSAACSGVMSRWASASIS